MHEAAHLYFVVDLNMIWHESFMMNNGRGYLEISSQNAWGYSVDNFKNIPSGSLETTMHSVHVKEKREHPRFDVKWPIAMMSIDGDAYGEIENISAGGAYVRCGKPLSEDDDLVMGILGLDRELLWLGAKVVRTDVKLTAEGQTEAIGVGVRFTSISTGDLRILNRVVLEREKQAAL